MFERFMVALAGLFTPSTFELEGVKSPNKFILYFGMMLYEIPHTSAVEMEEWVQQIAAVSGQAVDWCGFGGTDAIFAIGDLEAVYRAIEALKDLNPRVKRCPSGHEQWFDIGGHLIAW